MVEIRSRRFFQLLLVSLALGVSIWGCAPTVKETERYKPAENLLEILTDFQRHLNDDTYRFPTFKDITGQNIYKATLLRLKNFERLYPNKFGPIVAYSRAKAYEKLQDYSAAIASYEQIVDTGSELEPKAKEGLQVCRSFLTADSMPPSNGSLRETLSAFERRNQALGRLFQTHRGTPYGYLVMELQEQADIEKVRFLETNRNQIPSGTELTIVEYNRIIKRHEESKNVYRHILRLGKFFEKLAREYSDQHDPEGLNFSMEEFQSYADSAMGLYTMVASKDGIVEKAEAQGLANSLRAYASKVRSLHR
jgi:tetratricopeptide (TPR) repeat protein